MTEFARAMLGAGLVDILASDNHGDRRSLADRGDVDERSSARRRRPEILTTANPALPAGGEPLRPVPPVSFQRGVFDRLRELIFGSLAAVNAA